MHAISVTDAFGRAWDGMVTRLFKPFSLGKWFALGFSAWLAGFIDSAGGSVSFPSPGGEEADALNTFYPHLLDMWETYREWIIIGGIVAVVLIMVLSILFLWLGSRGKFMFLRNVIDDTAKVSEPWHAFRFQASSYFWWQLGFGLTVLILLAAMGAASFLLFLPAFQHQQWDAIAVAAAAVMILLALLVILTAITIQLLLNDFVVPLMMKHSMRTSEAWALFRPLFKHHLPQFTLYVLFRLVMYFVTMIAILAACILTCCCYLFLLVIPYINAVALLPVSVVFRLFSIEYLRAFGSEYDVFAPVEDLIPTTDTENGIPSPS